MIARAGKPLVKVTRIKGKTPRRPGFLAGQAEIPEDFDAMGTEEIRALLEGGNDPAPLSRPHPAGVKRSFTNFTCPGPRRYRLSLSARSVVVETTHSEPLKEQACAR